MESVPNKEKTLEQSNQIPSLLELALQYGTINDEQFKHVRRLHALKRNNGNPIGYEKLLLSRKFVTGYQVGLLKLIREYLIVKKQGEVFGKIAIEKGFVSREDVALALELQKKEFKQAKIKKLIGDILVELDYLTKEQRNLILKEQEQIEKSGGFATDSGVHVSIRQDQMEAVVKISKDTENICLQDIKNALGARKIQYGIYPDAILQCNLDLGNHEFVAAKQEGDSDGLTNRNVLYHFDTGKIETEALKKGALLAEQRLGGGTYLKKNVFGNHIEHSKDDKRFFRCADGIRLSEDNTKAFAGKTGVPYLSIERKLYVHSAVNVLEDADFRYGPLEKYANLNISGVLTGAYPVTAGQVTAREIRGAHIVAMGCVRSRAGITDTVISSQGDIHAAYLHNCRIETFGNIYIGNEIIDSHIFCSGKIDSGQCRVISSTLYAKKGIELACVGNNKTKACILGAGSEHHLLEKARQINFEIKNVSRPLDELKEKKDDQDRLAKKTFQKMIELKIFHDRAKNKKQKLEIEFKKRKDSFKKEKSKNIVALINNFEKRMASSVSSLKELNKTKKKYEKEKIVLERKIKRLEPKIKRKISELEMDLFAFFDWAKKQENTPQIKINHKAFPGTILKGIFSSLEIEKDLNNFLAFERHHHSTKEYQMVIQKN